MRLTVPYNADIYTEFCIFHRVDMDGRGAGAVVNLANNILDRHLFFYGANYEADFDIDRIISSFPKLKTMYVVDYSISPTDALKVLKKGINIIWCDHHVTALERYTTDDRFTEAPIEKAFIDTGFTHVTLKDKSSCPGKFYGYFSYDKSGAYITYKILKSVFMNDPESIKMYDNLGIIMDTISTYDTWNQTDLEKWSKALMFNTIARDHDFTPYSGLWNTIATDINEFYKLLEDGALVVKHDDINNKINAGAYAGTLTWMDKTFCVINDMRNSIALNSVFDPSVHDACLFFKFNPKERGFKNGIEVQGVWKITLFSHDSLSEEQKQNLDPTPIVKQFGGGGHKQACGFSCAELPFDLHEIKPIYRKTF